MTSHNLLFINYVKGRRAHLVDEFQLLEVEFHLTSFSFPREQEILDENSAYKIEFLIDK